MTLDLAKRALLDLNQLLQDGFDCNWRTVQMQGPKQTCRELWQYIHDNDPDWQPPEASLDGNYQLTPQQEAKLREVYAEVRAAGDGCDNTIPLDEAEVLASLESVDSIMEQLGDMPNLIERLGFDPDGEDGE